MAPGILQYTGFYKIALPVSVCVIACRKAIPAKRVEFLKPFISLHLTEVLARFHR